MKLRSAILYLRTVIPKLKDDVEYTRENTFFKDDLEQLLAWYQELQAYRDTGLTPEQVNLTEATLWKEQGLIARESDRERVKKRGRIRVPECCKKCLKYPFWESRLR